MAEPHHQQQQQVDVLPNQQQIIAILHEITPILTEPVVGVREHDVNGQGNPRINLALEGNQRLAIAGNSYLINVTYVSYGKTRARLGDDCRVRGRPVDYDNTDQEQYPIELSVYQSHYSPIFSYGIHNFTGPQAMFEINENNEYLYIIDEPTAVELRNQCVSHGNHKSLIYRFVLCAHRIAILAFRLYQWCDGNDVNDEDANSFRRRVYRLGNQFMVQIRRAIQSNIIYKISIVQREAMNYLPINNPLDPFRQPLLPEDIEQAPDIDIQNVQQLMDRINEYIDRVNASELFTRNWEQTFNEMASQQTSMLIEDLEEGQSVNQMIRLTNHQEFNVLCKIYNGTYHEIRFLFHSDAFTEQPKQYYYLAVVPGWDSLVVERQGRIPVHSHGLAGSYYEDPLQSGNNGFQAMTLTFPDVVGLNQRRLYFVNRAMAMELRRLFELEQVVEQYHQWFNEFIQRSRELCDLRLWYRLAGHLGAEPNWLPNIQDCFQRLFTIPAPLFRNYQIIHRLEQVWNFGLLVPNAQQQEHKVQLMKIKIAIYKIESYRVSKNTEPGTSGVSGTSGSTKKQRTK